MRKVRLVGVAIMVRESFGICEVRVIVIRLFDFILVKERDGR